MKNRKSIETESFNMPWFTLGLVAMGGFALWSNRFRIQRAVESLGIDTPWMKGSLSDTVQSGAAKIAGSVDHQLGMSERKSFAV